MVTELLTPHTTLQTSGLQRQSGRASVAKSSRPRKSLHICTAARTAMLSCMRIIAAVVAEKAWSRASIVSTWTHQCRRCAIRRTLTIEGSGALPQPKNPLAVGLIKDDVVIVGRPSDVLAFDGDVLHMHLTQDEVRYCRHGQRCDRRVLDLRVDTPLANVASIRSVGVVADHHVIPLGILAGSLLTAFGGGTLTYELAEHEHPGSGPAPFMLAFGIAILAVEIHARLARDTETVVR